MSELRNKVCDIVFRAVMASDGEEFDAMDAADAILAIREIRDALAMYNGDNRRAEWARMVDRRYPD